jgi:general L-amino acid transport system permease protein
MSDEQAQMDQLLAVDDAPVVAQLHPMRWMRENLFPSPVSSFLTIVTMVAIVGFVYGVLGWVFAPQRALVPEDATSVEAFVTDIMIDDLVRTNRVEPDQLLDPGETLQISTSPIEWEVPADVGSVPEFAAYLLTEPTADEFVTTVDDVIRFNGLDPGEELVSGETYRVQGSARQWNAISTNSRNYFTLASPTEQYIRIWISFGIICSLIGLSMAAWTSRPRVSSARIARKTTIFGAAFAGIALLAPWSFKVDTAFIAAGLALAVIGFFARRRILVRDGEEKDDLSLLGGVFIVLASLIGLMWLLPVLVDKMVIASSTKVPLTVMALVAVASFWIGKILRSTVMSTGALKGFLVGMWALSMPVIYMVILRDPALDFSARDIAIGLVIGLIGAAMVWFMSGPEAGEAGKGLAGFLVVLALMSWFPPLAGVTWLELIKTKLLLGGLASFALAASTFGGNARARVSMVGAWVATATLVTWFAIIAEGGTSLDLQSDFLGGMVLTILLAFGGILLSFPIGVLLALGRTSTMPLFRLMSTAYIETVRGVPLITVLFFGALFLPLFLPSDLRIADALKALIAITGFSGAYLAENVRGGLQSIPKGQYEASQALGMSVVQMTLFITLPQALRAVIPALVGQVISLFKDTSLVAIVGLADLLLVARAIVPGQPAFIGSQLENLVFVALVYWIFTFSFSRASLRIEKKLGLGER